MAREAYGFRRTTCPCRACAISCEHLPGALAPGDVTRLAGFLEYTDVGAFARENLLASEGERVVTSDRRVIRLPTLVPAMREDGHCKFLEGGRCTVHAFSPYGCAFLDAHHSDQELEERSRPMREDILRDFEVGGVYSTVWRELREAERVAPPAGERRYRLSRALKRERLV